MRVLLVPPGTSSEDIEALWDKYVSTAEGEDGEEEGALWVLRQQGDMIYVVSCTSVVIFLRRNSQKSTLTFRCAVCCWADN